jgi:hypothetical protein
MPYKRGMGNHNEEIFTQWNTNKRKQITNTSNNMDETQKTLKEKR